MISTQPSRFSKHEQSLPKKTDKIEKEVDFYTNSPFLKTYRTLRNAELLTTRLAQYAKYKAAISPSLKRSYSTKPGYAELFDKNPNSPGHTSKSGTNGEQASICGASVETSSISGDNSFKTPLSKSMIDQKSVAFSSNSKSPEINLRNDIAASIHQMNKLASIVEACYENITKNLQKMTSQDVIEQKLNQLSVRTALQTEKLKELDDLKKRIAEISIKVFPNSDPNLPSAALSSSFSGTGSSSLSQSLTSSGPLPSPRRLQLQKQILSLQKAVVVLETEMQKLGSTLPFKSSMTDIKSEIEGFFNQIVEEQEEKWGNMLANFIKQPEIQTSLTTLVQNVVETCKPKKLASQNDKIGEEQQDPNELSKLLEQEDLESADQRDRTNITVAESTKNNTNGTISILTDYIDHVSDKAEDHSKSITKINQHLKDIVDKIEIMNNHNSTVDSVLGDQKEFMKDFQGNFETLQALVDETANENINQERIFHLEILELKKQIEEISSRVDPDGDFLLFGEDSIENEDESVPKKQKSSEPMMNSKELQETETSNEENPRPKKNVRITAKTIMDLSEKLASLEEKQQNLLDLSMEQQSDEKLSQKFNEISEKMDNSFEDFQNSIMGELQSVADQIRGEMTLKIKSVDEKIDSDLIQAMVSSEVATSLEEVKNKIMEDIQSEIDNKKSALEKVAAANLEITVKIFKQKSEEFFEEQRKAKDQEKLSRISEKLGMKEKQQNEELERVEMEKINVQIEGVKKTLLGKIADDKSDQIEKLERLERKINEKIANQFVDFKSKLETSEISQKEAKISQNFEEISAKIQDLEKSFAETKEEHQISKSDLENNRDFEESIVSELNEMKKTVQKLGENFIAFSNENSSKFKKLEENFVPKDKKTPSTPKKGEKTPEDNVQKAVKSEVDKMMQKFNQKLANFDDLKTNIESNSQIIHDLSGKLENISKTCEKIQNPEDFVKKTEFSDSNSKILEEMNSKLQNVSQEKLESFAKQQEFDNFQQKIENILSKVDQQIENVSSSLDSKFQSFGVKLETQLQAEIIQKLEDSTDKKLSNFSNTIDSTMETLNSKIEASISTTDSKINKSSSNFDKKLDLLASQLESKLSKLSSDFDSKLSALESQSNDPSSKFEQLFEKLVSKRLEESFAPIQKKLAEFEQDIKVSQQQVPEKANIVWVKNEFKKLRDEMKEEKSKATLSPSVPQTSVPKKEKEGNPEEIKVLQETVAKLEENVGKLRGLEGVIQQEVTKMTTQIAEVYVEIGKLSQRITPVDQLRSMTQKEIQFALGAVLG